MSSSWSTAFKEIYGNTPTKSDYSLAPAHIKEEFYAKCPKSPATKKGKKNLVKAIGIRVKRPADDEWSPIKKPSAKRPPPRHDGDELATSSKSIIKPSSSSIAATSGSRALFERRSPRKQVSFSPLKKALRPVQNTEPKSPSRLQPFRSPKKKAGISISSPFRSLFDTPEKGQPSPFGISLTVGPSAVPKSPATPIRSPRKPIRKNECVMKNVESLLLPTPEKRVKPEVVYEPFAAEELPAKKGAPAQPTRPMVTKFVRAVNRRLQSLDDSLNSRVPEGGEAKVFNPTTGKVVKRAFKRPATGSPRPRKKKDENFVRINMKKKSFVRGKVTAEQKRKMKRKMNYKRRFGGK